MTKHPITPPPDLIDQWQSTLKGDCCPVEFASASIASIAIRAAQWGADQELEACCLWVNSVDDDDCFGANLRAARRPKPPSLKEQAKQALFRFDANAHINADEMQDDFDLIRRALEQLP
jgi:hypothetical protein